MPAHVLSPQSVILPNVSVAFAVLATAAGGTALYSPLVGITNFGLKPVKDEAGMELANALTQVYGIRNASMGLSSIAVWYLAYTSTGAAKVAYRRALGTIMLMQAGIPLVDGIVSKRQGQSQPWNHWTFVPITLMLGGALLATSDAF